MNIPDISEIDLRLLRVLDAVLETSDISRAAKMLLVSPSAVSHSLRSLRERFADPLLVRTRGRLEPTPLAKALQPALRESLYRLAKLMQKEEVFDPALSTRSLSLAAPDYQLFMMLPPIVANMRRIAPLVDLRFRALGPNALDDLASGELDLVLAGAEVETTLALDGEVMRSRIMSEPFCCLMSADNPAASLAELTLASYLEAPHVMTSTAGEQTDHVDECLERLNLRRRKAVTVPSYMAAAWYATSSDMIATLPGTVAHRAAERTGGIIRKAPIDLPYSMAYLWWHPRFQNDPGHTWWRKRLLDAFAPHR
jgi:DNA-binding transcriptional LysR family regulator